MINLCDKLRHIDEDELEKMEIANACFEDFRQAMCELLGEEHVSMLVLTGNREQGRFTTLTFEDDQEVMWLTGMLIEKLQKQVDKNKEKAQ